jgi:hypothetical protein
VVSKMWSTFFLSIPLTAMTMTMCTGEPRADELRLLLPDQAMITATAPLKVKLPTESAATTPVVLRVTLEINALGQLPFIVNACLDDVCDSFDAHALDNLAFFPPPQVGEEREFIIEIPASLMAAGPTPHDLVLSLHPVNASSSAPSGEVTVTRISVANRP